jgi:GntR family transcriptional regulator
MSPQRPVLEQLETSPLVDRARSQLLQAILEHRFEDKLPAETALAEMLNVSRTTVRAALQGLEQDGLIVRRRSIGTLINRRADVASMALHRMVGFDWLLEEQGYSVEIESDWTVGAATPELVSAFSLDPDVEYLLSDKRYTANGQLAIHVRDVVLLAFVRPVELNNLSALAADQPSLFDFSTRLLNKPIQSAVAQIIPMVKRNTTDTRLEVSRNQPFVRLHEKHMSHVGDVLAYSVVDVDDRYVKFEVYRRQ